MHCFREFCSFFSVLECYGKLPHKFLGQTVHSKITAVIRIFWSGSPSGLQNSSAYIPNFDPGESFIGNLIFRNMTGVSSSWSGKTFHRSGYEKILVSRTSEVTDTETHLPWVLVWTLERCTAWYCSAETTVGSRIHTRCTPPVGSSLWPETRRRRREGTSVSLRHSTMSACVENWKIRKGELKFMGWPGSDHR